MIIRTVVARYFRRPEGPSYYIEHPPEHVPPDKAVRELNREFQRIASNRELEFSGFRLEGRRLVFVFSFATHNIFKAIEQLHEALKRVYDISDADHEHVIYDLEYDDPEDHWWTHTHYGDVRFRRKTADQSRVPRAKRALPFNANQGTLFPDLPGRA